jgi:chemotaxis methyl-accepting protein methylase
MEPYSFVMQFLHSKPKDAKKFLPITAKDIDKDNIYAATSGHCGASMYDQRRAQEFLDYTLWDYVDWQKSSNPNNDMILSPKQFVKDQIIFSQGNIFNDIENLPQKNNVILCRNMWLYLNSQEQDMLLRKLSDKLDATSTVVLGIYDFLNNYKLKLDFDYYGFKEDIPYVFSKNC